MMKFAEAAPKVMLGVPGCSVPEAVEALRFAVIEFCTRTRILSNWVERQSNALTFDTTGADATQVVQLLDAKVDGRDATVLHRNSADLERASVMRPVLLHDQDLNTSLKILPEPSPPLPVRLFVAFAPTPDATEFPDFLWLAHREALKHGALARLLAEPGTTYVNDAKAAWHLSEFQTKADELATQIGLNQVVVAHRLRVNPA
ncbi:MAG: hypothetical protein WAQ08_16130 [Aquabacterium sp.]|uniref:hypothetical protein n=1 Tax=Aquabacterium sp. TaxID=1872578 RepID=UPI003BAF8006